MRTCILIKIRNDSRKFANNHRNRNQTFRFYENIDQFEIFRKINIYKYIFFIAKTFFAKNDAENPYLLLSDILKGGEKNVQKQCFYD